MIRNLLFLASLMFTFSVTAQDLTIHVNKKGQVGFVDSNGNEVIKCAYESAYPFKNGYAIVSKSNKLGIIDTKGKVVLPLKYTSITNWGNDLLLINNGKTQGLAQRNGKIVLPAKYSFISQPNCYGKALLAQGGKQTVDNKKTYMANAKLGIVNGDGSIAVTPKYKGLFEFSTTASNIYPGYEGFFMASALHYLNDTLVTNCEYLGFNKTFSTGKSGLMDGKGKEIIKPNMFTDIMLPHNGMARYYECKKKETICGYYNLSTGKSFKAATFKKNVSDIKFWTHGDFTGDIAPVNGDSWTFIDKTGNVIRKGYTKLKHDALNGLWAAKTDTEKWDVFNEQNQDIKDISGYEDIIFPQKVNDKEIFAVKKDGLYGAVDKRGNIVIPIQYSQVNANIYDVMGVKKDGLWGMYSANGTELVPIKYINIQNPTVRNQQDFWVQKSDSLLYHFNVSDKSVASTGFEHTLNFNDGIALARPAGMKLNNTEINRAQAFAPNSSHADISAVNLEKKKDLFGYLVNTQNEVIFDLPVSSIYLKQVIDLLKANSKSLTETEKKNILLEVTKENRCYDLKSTLSEDEWNY